MHMLPKRAELLKANPKMKFPGGLSPIFNQIGG